MCKIFRRRNNEGMRFETEGDINFFLRNQSLSSHSIQPSSLLSLDLQIMDHEVGFRSHDGYESNEIFLSFNKYNMVIRPQCLQGEIVAIFP